MDTLSFDLIRSITSYLSYSEVINFLSTTKRLFSELKNDTFWRCYLHSQCPSLFLLRWFRENSTSLRGDVPSSRNHRWREMCATDIYRVHIGCYLSHGKRKSKCLLPIVYQEDLLLKSITGDVYLCIAGDFFRTDLGLDKLIFSEITNESVTLLYLSQGQLWLYQATTNNLKCRNYHLIEGSYDLDILDGNCVQAYDVYHVVLVREGNIVTHLSITFPRPCERDTAPRVTETLLDIEIPLGNRVIITSVAIGVHQPASVEEKARLALGVVTSSHWLYCYSHVDAEMKFMYKHRNILLVANYSRKIIILDGKGNISRMTASYSYHTELTCQYTLRGGCYYIRDKDCDDRLYTLRNYISRQLRRSHQSCIPTTLAKMELYRCRQMKK